MGKVHRFGGGGYNTTRTIGDSSFPAVAARLVVRLAVKVVFDFHLRRRGYKMVADVMPSLAAGTQGRLVVTIILHVVFEGRYKEIIING